MEFAQGAEIVRERSGGVCEVCHGANGPGVQTHHRRARGMGGRFRAGQAVNLPSNLVRVCLVDHSWIEANPAQADALGLLHPADPSDPVWLHTAYGQAWWILDDEGCYGWCHDREDPPVAARPPGQPLPV